MLNQEVSVCVCCAGCQSSEATCTTERAGERAILLVISRLLIET